MKKLLKSRERTTQNIRKKEFLQKSARTGIMPAPNNQSGQSHNS
jgi:hypothetical protein